MTLFFVNTGRRALLLRNYFYPGIILYKILVEQNWSRKIFKYFLALIVISFYVLCDQSLIKSEIVYFDIIADISI